MRRSHRLVTACAALLATGGFAAFTSAAVRAPEVEKAVPAEADPRAANPDVDWAVLDLATGCWAVANGEAVERRADGAFAPRLVQPFAGAEIELRLAVAGVDLLWVRPGEGAWYAALRDGAAGDVGGDGFVSLARSAFRPLGRAGEVPAALAPDDVVVAVDPATLRFAVRCGAGLPAPATS